MYLIINEEFAADDEKQHDTDKDIRECRGNAAIVCDLPCTDLQEADQEGGEKHKDGVKFCKPRDHDRRKASTAYRMRGNRVIVAADKQKAAEAADRAGDQHCAHND